MIKNLFYTVDDFSISIPEWNLSSDGVSVLHGRSGSGKTTIIKILSGLVPCSSLEWHFKGKDIAQLSSGERKIGVLFQDLYLFPHLSAEENIFFPAKARGLDFSDIEEDFDHMVRFLNIEKKLKSSIDTLSGGEKQRVALVRALITRPQFLFLDEPLVHVDHVLRGEILYQIKVLINKWKLPTLVISHNLEELKGWANDFYLLENGNIKNMDKNILLKN